MAVTAILALAGAQPLFSLKTKKVTELTPAELEVVSDICRKALQDYFGDAGFDRPGSGRRLDGPLSSMGHSLDMVNIIPLTTEIYSRHNSALAGERYVLHDKVSSGGAVDSHGGIHLRTAAEHAHPGSCWGLVS